ncbi:MAG: sensor histidine kinase [Parvibaculaceae bacterium]
MSIFTNQGRSTRAQAAGISASGHRSEQNNASARQYIAKRIGIRQLALIDLAAKNVFTNVLAAAIISWIVRHEIAQQALLFWVLSLLAVCLVLRWRVFCHERVCHKAVVPPALIKVYLREHAFFAALVGLSWGLFALYASTLISSWHLIIISLTVMGCVSAAVSGLGGYLPALFTYALAALIPVVYVNFAQISQAADGLWILIVVYAGAVLFNAFGYNRNILETLRLRAENERLADSVVVAEAATEAATRSKWRSFAHLSHELRTPMNAVLGFSDIMRQQMFGALGPRYLDYANSIYGSGSQALALIDNILEVSCARMGELPLAEEHFDPAALVHELEAEFAAEAAKAGIAMATRVCHPATGLYADRAKIRQALHNLVSNALRYTEAGGHVSLELSHSDEGFCLIVSDTGIGIAAEEIEACQEPFVRLGDPLIARTNGAGLGLPIAKHFLEAHGGTLSIESRSGAGTAVTIALPPSCCVSLTEGATVSADAQGCELSFLRQASLPN